jgi:hypothetical protein
VTRFPERNSDVNGVHGGKGRKVTEELMAKFMCDSFQDFQNISRVRLGVPDEVLLFVGDQTLESAC